MPTVMPCGHILTFIGSEIATNSFGNTSQVNARSFERSNCRFAQSAGSRVLIPRHSLTASVVGQTDQQYRKQLKINLQQVRIDGDSAGLRSANALHPDQWYSQLAIGHCYRDKPQADEQEISNRQCQSLDQTMHSKKCPTG